MAIGGERERYDTMLNRKTMEQFTELFSHELATAFTKVEASYDGGTLEERAKALAVLGQVCSFVVDYTQMKVAEMAAHNGSINGQLIFDCKLIAHNVGDRLADALAKVDRAIDTGRPVANMGGEKSWLPKSN